MIASERKIQYALQYHMFNNPLYIGERNGEIKLIVVGFDEVNQFLLDWSLQLTQMPRRSFSVLVLYGNEEEKEKYLSIRNLLADFFDIMDFSEREKPETVGSYGRIYFSFDERLVDIQSFNQSIQSSSDYSDLLKIEEFSPTYIFLNLDIAANIDIAKNTESVCRSLGNDAAIACWCKKSRIKELEETDVMPFYTDDCGTERKKFKDEINRIAFNVYTIFWDYINSDYRKIKSDFCSYPRRHTSCVSRAVFFKYVFHSIGIELDLNNIDAAVKQYVKEYRSHIAEFVYFQHSSWIVQQICSGSRVSKSFEEFIDNKYLDIDEEYNPFLVKSGYAINLQNSPWKDNRHQKWNSSGKEEYEKLDDLDKVSIGIHRAYVKRAKEAKLENLLEGSTISDIEYRINCDPKAGDIFYEWLTCMKDIWNGDTKQTLLYKGLKESLVSAIENSELIDNYKKELIKKRVDMFDLSFYPIRKSIEYFDYKTINLNLVNATPYILTHSDNLCLVMPYSITDENNSSILFRNLATATILNPKKIVYLCRYMINSKKTINNILRLLPKIFKYMEKKNLRAEVEFVILLDEQVPLKTRESIETSFLESNERVKKVDFLENFTHNLIPFLKEKYFKAEKIASHSAAFEVKDGFISGFFAREQISEIPTYFFNIQKMKFENRIGCEFISYKNWNVKSFISVNDMVLFGFSSSKTNNKPEFYDHYNELWEKYRQSPYKWKDMCSKIKKQLENTTKKFQFYKIKKNEKTECVYNIQLSCKNTVDVICRQLVKYEIINKYNITAYSSENCQIKITAHPGVKKSLDDLFSDTIILMHPDLVKYYTVKGYNNDTEEFVLQYEGLYTDSFDLSDFDEEQKNILKYLFEINYIRSCNVDVSDIKISNIERIFNIKGYGQNNSNKEEIEIVFEMSSKINAQMLKTQAFNTLKQHKIIKEGYSVAFDENTRKNTVKVIPLNPENKKTLEEMLKYIDSCTDKVKIKVNSAAGGYEIHAITSKEVFPSQKIDLTIANKQIKQLLTVEGRILEVYVYHKIKELKEFNDVRSGFEIDWQRDVHRNEVDCIVTKGFSSAFIECKAQNKYPFDFLNKLPTVVRNFGINATTIIIIDRSGSKCTDEDFKKMVETASLMDVITIYDSEEIDDIGNTLLKIFKGEYHSSQ